MFTAILKKAVPLPKFKQYNNFLFVGPHPDDIEVACGATVAKLVEMGKKVTFLIVTDGSGGCLDNSITSQQLIAMRRQESIASAKLLGVSDIRFLDYKDGGTMGNNAIGIAIAQVIADIQAQIVFCPDYKTVSEYHPDHIAVGQMATYGYFLAQYPLIGVQYGVKSGAPVTALSYYYTDRPNTYFAINKKHYKLKMQAIACHKSQFDENALKSFKTYFNIRNYRFGLRILRRRAEGYRVLGNVHMHCFPEASDF